MFILPWLTLIFMKKDDVKRFMPLGLFTLSLSIIVTEIGIATGLWVIQETTFPLVVIPTYIYGIFPVIAMWIFKFTYGRFWIYQITELVLNLSYVIILLPWIASRGIIVFKAPLISYFVAMGQGMLLYIYQMWQEDALVPAVKKLFSLKLQPSAAKPTFEDEDGNNNSR
jgi:hypothetical protein